MVPITAIVFSLLRAVGSMESESRLSQFVSEHLFASIPGITDKIREFSGKVSIGALGGGGLIFTRSPATRSTAMSRRSSTTSGG